jgi:hypothetical protein
MFRHVSALAVGHLQGALTFYVMYSLFVKARRGYSIYMIEFVILNIKYHNS